MLPLRHIQYFMIIHNNNNKLDTYLQLNLVKRISLEFGKDLFSIASRSFETFDISAGDESLCGPGCHGPKHWLVGPLFLRLRIQDNVATCL